MSGHSKWASIKHKKGALDAKRGKIFTKYIREIAVAARAGGGDPNTNARLRKALSDAKAQNMPNDTIQRAVDRGSGKLEGVQYEEVTYEGYGPGGVAVLIEAMTDSRNRTVSELRHIFAKHQGNLGESGSVAWIFHKKGSITLDQGARTEDEIFDVALEAGAEDVQHQGDAFEIITKPEDFEKVLQTVKSKGIEPTSAGVTMVPQNYVKLAGKDAQTLLKLMESLDDHDDVQRVSANFDISAEEMEQAAGGAG